MDITHQNRALRSQGQVDIYINATPYVDDSLYRLFIDDIEVEPVIRIYDTISFQISTLKTGIHTIRLEYPGDSYLRPMNRTSSIELRDCLITIPDTYVMDIADTIFAELPSDAEGNVKFYVDSKLVETYDAGELIYFMMPDVKFGQHTVKIVYSGDKKYESTSLSKCQL